MKIYILAAGKGSRMGTFTNDWPKVMTRIGHETLISSLVRQWHQWSQKKIYVVGRYHANVLQTHLHSLPEPTEMVFEPFPHREAGSSVHFARQHAQSDCWIISGDSYIPDDFFDQLSITEKQHKLFIQEHSPPTKLMAVKDRLLHSSSGSAHYAGISYWLKCSHHKEPTSGAFTLAQYIAETLKEEPFILEGTGVISNFNSRILV